MLQRTLKEAVEFCGIALHSGKKSNILITPAPEDTGVVFIRTDLEGCPRIEANWKNAVDSELSTVLMSNGARVATVEHLLSALRGLSIDNVFVELSSDELPVLDGSSYEYVEAFKRVGFLDQNRGKKYLQVVKPVSISVEDKFIYLLPSSEFKVTCRIDFSHPCIGLQHFEYNGGQSDYENLLCRAKTFGFMEQVKILQEKGYILGGSMDNAIVLDSEGVINSDKLTYENEFVRHKLLDIVGDMALVGNYQLLAHVVAYKSGHSLHSLSLKELHKRSSYFRIVDEPKTINDKIFRDELISIFGFIPVR